MNRRMDIVSSYLKGTALTWFNRSGAREWENSLNTNQSFVHLFQRQFCDTFKMTQWKHQLRNRKQRAGETVEEYTSAMEELWKRLDPQRRRTELDRITEYIEGLRPEFIVPVQSSLPTTVNAAINQAKATETAFSMGADLSAYSINPGYLPNLYGAAVPAQTAHVAFMNRMNNDTPTVDNIERIIENKLKEQIEKALSRTNYSNTNNNNSNRSNNSNYSNNYNNRNNNNNNSFNNRNRNRDKECYKCGKKGHIAKDCWSKNRQQNNNNNSNSSNHNNNRSSGNGQNSQSHLN